MSTQARIEAPLTRSPVSPSRHRLICKICSHPQRAFIEQEFLHWYNPDEIAPDYNVTPRSIYRHAHATGLFDRRRKNLRFVYETYLERARHVPVNADQILRAARAYARINKDGEWVEPHTTHVVLASVPRAEPEADPEAFPAETFAPSAEASADAPTEAAESLSPPLLEPDLEVPRDAQPVQALPAGLEPEVAATPESVLAKDCVGATHPGSPGAEEVENHLVNECQSEIDLSP